MHFAFTEDQLAITEAASEMLVESCTPADLRRLLASGETLDNIRWQTIVDMGLPGICAPEDKGGLGLGLIDLVGIAEAAGYVALPEPLVEQAGIAVPLLAGLKDDKGWLARVLSGEIVAIGHPANPFVADADSAAALLLGHGDELHLVERDAVALTRAESFDPFRRLFRVKWTPSDKTRVGSTWGDAAERGAVLAAAQMLGLGQRCIDMAVAYAKDRHQFGKPIGSYQAVKHLLATAQVKIEFARPVVHAAAAELSRGNVAAKARVAHAKLAAAEAADLAARTAVQVHGAMGMTWEVDVHFFLKRALALKTAFGTPAGHRAQVIDRMRTLPTGPEFAFASEVAGSPIP
ncbi:acyl-CoA dehydrogenase family protein [Novosphingobium sp. G106]|uniref:acyl-CoA dehydrogenase family protein n=1 Tax=Novosphingobium sp. G106 TaxID=2849500 RepID=UPI001C2DB90D|nr:acyl-CoA dehydrogenase family protein [Novosphingobium sp. G106]MBV1686188.1 acyl-CoA dehydrogenase family protein [Novosphingobium sp. G106]